MYCTLRQAQDDYFTVARRRLEMKQETITSILVTPEAVEWVILRPGRSGFQNAGEGKLERSEEGALEPGALAAIKTPAVLAIPSTQLLLRVMELPAVDDDELAGMVELQIDKFSPFPIEQMVVSHEVLSRSETSCTVVVAAVREMFVNEIGDLLSENGIKIARVDSELLGCWKNLVDSGQLADSGRETLVLVSGDTVEVLTHESGVLIGISCLGRVDGFSDQGTVAEIARDVAHLIVGVEVEYGRAGQSKIALWSDRDGLAPFVGALRDACGAEIEERSLEILPNALYGSAVRYLSGVAQVDLKPASWRERERAKRFRRQLIGSTFGILGVWAVLVGSCLGWLAFEQSRLNALNAEADRRLGPANEVRQLRLQVNMIERYTDSTYSALECLREISSVQPEGVDLTSFTYRKGDGLSIDGEADSGQLVSAFNEALNRSKLFAQVKPGRRTLTKTQRHRFSFEIVFPGAERDEG